MENNYSQLEENIGYTFKDKELLRLALMHRSYGNEIVSVDMSNERLEFLGDAVLSLVSAEQLYKEFPDLREGMLTKIRASLVCTESLAKYSKEIDLQDFLLLGKGEKRSFTFGEQHHKLLEDTFEALIAAIYLDGGLENARAFIVNMMADDIRNFDISNIEEKTFHDYKSTLQNMLQKNNGQLPQYVLVDQTGPCHDSTFTIRVLINGKSYGVGVGKSKKSAEQEAAKKALAVLNNEKR